MTNEYNWRRDSPGADTAQRIKKRVLDALDRFGRGDTETIQEALDLYDWCRKIDFSGVPDKEKTMISSLIGEIVDAYLLVPADRAKGSRAAQTLIGFLRPHP